MIAEIDPSHYALKLISKMFKFEQNERITSGDVFIQLKRIKQKVNSIVLCIHMGERITDGINQD